MHITVYGKPITKKNSQQIIMVKGRPIIIPSKQFKAYEKDFAAQITGDMKVKRTEPCNVKCVYFMPTHGRCDLVNLIEGTLDALVSTGILADDCSTIVKGHDGSRVDYDKQNPRVEVTITDYSEGE